MFLCDAFAYAGIHLFGNELFDFFIYKVTIEKLISLDEQLFLFLHKLQLRRFGRLKCYQNFTFNGLVSFIAITRCLYPNLKNGTFIFLILNKWNIEMVSTDSFGVCLAGDTEVKEMLYVYVIQDIP